MPSLVIVDAGPLVAWADADDDDHDAVLRELRRPNVRFVVAGLPLAEAAYLVNMRLGPLAESRLIRAMDRFEVVCPSPTDLTRMADIMAQYIDFPLGASDASVVALAERYETDTILTLDHRHFDAIRPRHVDHLRLLPE